MYKIFLIAHVIISISLILMILAQSSQGAEITSSSNSSGNVFGSKGSGSFITKSIINLAVLFFCSCLVIGTYANKSYKNKISNIQFEEEITEDKASDVEK